MRNLDINSKNYFDSIVTNWDIIRQGFFGEILCKKAFETAQIQPDKTAADMFLHHVLDLPIAVQEMTRILKPGGVLVITDMDKHNFGHLKSEHHDQQMGSRGRMCAVGSTKLA